MPNLSAGRRKPGKKLSPVTKKILWEQIDSERLAAAAQHALEEMRTLYSTILYAKENSLKDDVMQFHRSEIDAVLRYIVRAAEDLKNGLEPR